MTDDVQDNVADMGQHPRAFAWVSMIGGPALAAFLLLMLFNGSALSQLVNEPSWYYFSAAFYQPTLFALFLGVCALPVSGLFLWRLIKKLPSFETFPHQFFVMNATIAGAIFGFLFAIAINLVFEVFSSKPDLASIRGEMFISVVISTIIGAMLSFVASHICLVIGRLAKWIN